MEDDELSKFIEIMHETKAKGRKMDWNIPCISKNINIVYKHKVESLEGEKQLWLQEQETRKQTMDKMTIQILRLNNMVATNEFNRQNGNKFK
jgi:hypothetical protein